MSEGALLPRSRTGPKAPSGSNNGPESQHRDGLADRLFGTGRHRSTSRGRQAKGGGEDGTKGSSGQPAGAEITTSKGGRRRAIFQDHSEDEEGDRELANQASKPLMKGKAIPCNDSDIDMQLEDVSPEHGGSSLKLSLSNEDFTAAPNQAAALRIDTINLADRTPTQESYQSPKKVTTSDNHSAKRRRGELGGLATISDAHKPLGRKLKEAIPSIDIVSHMWLGFSIHEAITTQKGMGIIHETRTNEEFLKIDTPSREVLEFRTLRRAFPRVPQVCYPHERPDAVPGNHTSHNSRDKRRWIPQPASPKDST